MFDYLERSTRQEREQLADELRALYNGALEDERRTYSRALENKRSTKARENYAEAVQRLGAITDIFDALHIDYEPGRLYGES